MESGGTWGTFDPLNAGEPWRFLEQVYFKKSQGKSFFLLEVPQVPPNPYM